MQRGQRKTMTRATSKAERDQQVIEILERIAVSLERVVQIVEQETEDEQ